MTMTNNPTIDGVSRATIERIADRLSKAQMFKESTELRAIIDAPSVERQELASPLSDIGQAQLLAICRGAAQRCEEQHDYMASASSDPHNWFPHKWVLDAMSSLLQINANNQQSTIARLEARVAELESGRGEPIKTPEMPYKMLPLEEDGWFQCVNAYEAAYPLFTAPPAPVAVVLPTTQELRELVTKAAREADLKNGANYYTAAELAAGALFEKIKELNP